MKIYLIAALVLLLSTSKSIAQAAIPPLEDCGQIWITPSLRWTLIFFRSGAATLKFAASNNAHSMKAGSFDFERVCRIANAAVIDTGKKKGNINFVVREARRKDYGISTHSSDAAMTPDIKLLFSEFLATSPVGANPYLDSLLLNNPIWPAEKTEPNQALQTISRSVPVAAEPLCGTALEMSDF